MNKLVTDKDISDNVFFFINQPNSYKKIIDNILIITNKEEETRECEFTELYKNFYESVDVIKKNLIIEKEKCRKKSFILPTPR